MSEFDATHHTDADYAEVAMYSAGAGAFGALVSKIHKPLTIRRVCYAVGCGIIFGAIGGVLIYWQYPTTPKVIVCISMLGIGMVSTSLAAIAIKIGVAAREQAAPAAGDWLAGKFRVFRQNGNANANGPSAHTGPADRPGEAKSGQPVPDSHRHGGGIAVDVSLRANPERAP